MQTDRDPGWATPSELADLYDVTIQTVLTWVRRGHTTRRDDGLIDAHAVDSYLEGRPTSGPGSGFHRDSSRPGATDLLLSQAE